MRRELKAGKVRMQDRVVERRREALVRDVPEARHEFAAGEIRPVNPADLLKTIRS